MTIRQQLVKELLVALDKLSLSDIASVVDYPADPKHGDYSTNVAMIGAKKLHKNPLELAESIAAALRGLDVKIIKKIEVVKPGFINIWVKEESFIASLSDQEVKGNFTGKKISVEYTDPNPFKELHIGHLYSNTIGESLCRIFAANGATVWRADYFGDVGMHVAKSIWGLKEQFKVQSAKFKVIEDLEKASLEERIRFLGEGYALGSNRFAESDEVKEAVKHLNKLVYLAAQQMWEKEKGLQPTVDYRQGAAIDEKELGEVYRLYTLGRKWSLEYFERLYRRLGTKFDGYYPESIAGERGYALVKENIAKGIFVESEGAVIFPGEKFGLHTRVFINKLGLPTYEAKEIGLSPWKYEDFPYDLSFIVTANEIAGYFSVLVEALKQVKPDLGQKTKPVLHGMVRLPQGKMSSRSGNVITVEWLLDEAKKRVLPLVSAAVDNRDEVAEMVALAAVKYAFLKSSIGKDVTFDFDESISFEGNSGPYIQYTFARTQSVLKKAETEQKGELGQYLPLEEEERELLRLLARFSEVIQEAAERLAPNQLCSYLFEVAHAFNLFYQKCPILKPHEIDRPDGTNGTDAVREFRLLLTRATGETLKKGLDLLGIASPQAM